MDSRRILLIDDSSRALEGVEFAFKLDGHTVHNTRSGAQALGAFEQELPDLIISASDLSDMAACELYRALKRSRNYPPGRFFIVGSPPSAELRLAEIGLGLGTRLALPISISEIQTRVRPALARPVSADPALLQGRTGSRSTIQAGTAGQTAQTPAAAVSPRSTSQSRAPFVVPIRPENIHAEGQEKPKGQTGHHPASVTSGMRRTDAPREQKQEVFSMGSAARPAQEAAASPYPSGWGSPAAGEPSGPIRRTPARQEDPRSPRSKEALQSAPSLSPGTSASRPLATAPVSPSASASRPATPSAAPQPQKPTTPPKELRSVTSWDIALDAVLSHLNAPESTPSPSASDHARAPKISHETPGTPAPTAVGRQASEPSARTSGLEYLSPTPDESAFAPSPVIPAPPEPPHKQAEQSESAAASDLPPPLPSSHSDVMRDLFNSLDEQGSESPASPAISSPAPTPLVLESTGTKTKTASLPKVTYAARPAPRRRSKAPVAIATVLILLAAAGGAAWYLWPTLFPSEQTARAPARPITPQRQPAPASTTPAAPKPATPAAAPITPETPTVGAQAAPGDTQKQEPAAKAAEPAKAEPPPAQQEPTKNAQSPEKVAQPEKPSEVAEKQAAPPPAAKEGPSYSELVATGDKQLKREQGRKAIASYRKALELTPDGAEAHLGLGLALAEVKPSEAIPHLSKGLDALPKHAQGWLMLGTCYQLTGKKANARSAYETFLKLEPKGDMADEVRAILSRL